MLQRLLDEMLPPLSKKLRMSDGGYPIGTPPIRVINMLLEHALAANQETIIEIEPPPDTINVCFSSTCEQVQMSGYIHPSLMRRLKKMGGIDAENWVAQEGEIGVRYKSDRFRLHIRVSSYKLNEKATFRITRES